MQRSTVSVLVLALVPFAPAVAVAEQDREVVVNVGDLDTSTFGGASRALRRIERAAENACNAAPGLRSFAERRAVRACVDEAMSRAVSDLGDPMVAARFGGSRIAAATARTIGLFAPETE